MKERISLFSWIAFTLAFVGVVYLFFSVRKLDQVFFERSQKILISMMGEYTHNVDEALGEDFDRLWRDAEYREEVARWLSVLVSNVSKYIFIAYRDKRGNFRYLVDGSKEDRGYFGQKIDVNKRYWNEAMQKGGDLFFTHRLQTLWITYLHPIKRGGKVVAILAVDFDPSFLNRLQTLFAPIKQVTFALFALLLLSVVVFAFEIYRNFKLKRLALIDPLTQLYNRVFLRDFLNKITPSEYAILMLDIDHFKKINDTYGHKAGDLVLKEFARRIRRNLREGDIFVRFGGEEFLIFLKRGDHSIDLVDVAERLRKAIESEDFDIGEKKIHVTVSVGMFLRPEYARNISEAIKRADGLLYEAKRGGRNRVVWSDERGEERKELGSIRDAIEEGRIFCLYQPIVDGRSGRVVKYEALVRLKSKEGAILYPGEFLQSIYYTTVYHTLTKEVLRQVFGVIERKKVHISINLNLSDIKDNTIFDIIEKIIEQNARIASSLTIEVLENEPLEQSETIIARLKRLKGYGVSIAIDDFGKGYSNFDIFDYLPIDILKIDGSIVRNVTSSNISFAIVESVKTFAQTVRAQVVAEFVESEAIYRKLLELDIALMQGYYFSPPIPEEKIGTLDFVTRFR